jgi:hypothetical protein
MVLASQLPDPAALAALRQQTGLTTVVVITQSMPPAEAGDVAADLAEGSPGSARPAPTATPSCWTRGE